MHDFPSTSCTLHVYTYFDGPMLATTAHWAYFESNMVSFQGYVLGFLSLSPNRAILIRFYQISLLQILMPEKIANKMKCKPSM